MTCLLILCQVTLIPSVKSFRSSMLTLSSNKELFFITGIQTVLTTQSTAYISAV